MRHALLTFPPPPDPLGLTLAEFAAARGTHPQAVRKDYGRMMRFGEGLTLPPILRRHDDEGTLKFCLPAGESTGAAGGQVLETESVIIPMTSYRSTNWFTLCVSSQVGCRMGCTFCETGRMGLLRNLTAGEIVQQRLVARTLRLAQIAQSPSTDHQITRSPDHPIPPSTYFADGIQNIVFMGMGEPLDNFENLIQAIRVLNEPAGLDFPLTQITVSTVGRIDGLRKLAALGWPNLRIAVSLNAANDKLRDELMPINKGMPLAELQRALLEYPLPRKTRYRFLIEYVLIKGVNDSPADADAVADFCRPLPCIVNIIPYNPQHSATYETPSDDTIAGFVFRLKDQGIFTKRRITHGRDLMGACGQLGNPDVRRK
jgi:23S rRNA (adenine2503-C2)-methyltransferase